MNNNILLVLLAGITLVPGCTMGPKYARPKAPVPPEWPTGPAYQQTATSNAPQAADLKWQEFFTDENLRRLTAMALQNNRDLRLAALNVQRARALYGIQRAELFPELGATASLSQQHVPPKVEGFPDALTIKRYDVSLGLADWEIDFFGRIRSLKEEALQTYLATEQGRRSAQLSLVSAVGQAYLTLAADRENLELTQTTLNTPESAYALVKRRVDLGVVSELDLHRAQTQVDTARGDLARYTQQVAQDENALNLLVGTPPPTALLPTNLKGVTPPQEISAGVSSEVLLRRPDVLQAENELRAANADIGAARAAFFPRISLSAAVGTASTELSGLFKGGSDTWSYAPQIALPIFDPRLRPASRQAKVQRDIAVTQYEKTIQTAFREVADVLAIRGTVDQQVAAQQSLVNASAETYRLSAFRYERGIDSYLSTLDAQRSLYAAQQGLVSLQLEKLSSLVRLYAVLGGG